MGQFSTGGVGQFYSGANSPLRNILVISESSMLTRLMLDVNRGGVALARSLRGTLVRGFLGAVLQGFPEADVVVKFPSYLSFDIDDALELLPDDIPWCFSSRWPHDVLESLRRAPSPWLSDPSVRIKYARLCGIPAGRGAEKDLIDLHAALLTKYLGNAVHSLSARGIFLDYADLGPKTVRRVVESFLEARISDACAALVDTSLGYYSKSIELQRFVPKPPSEKRTTYARLNEMYDVYLANLKPPFARRQITL